MSEKRFVIHYPRIIAEQDALLWKKAERNTQEGNEAYSGGSISLFDGYDPAKYGSEYYIGLELFPDSQKEIANRVINPIMGIAERNGIEGVYAGLGDITSHVSLQPAVLRSLTPDELEKIKQELDRNKFLHMIGRILTGIEIPLNRLVLSGRDMYLCADQFRTDLYPIYKARRIINKVFQKNSQASSDQIMYRYTASQGLSTGVIPVDYRDIVHSNVGRILGVNEQGSLVDFAAQVDSEVGRSVREKPIHVTVGEVYQGMSLDFIRTRGGRIKE